jgi:hypothetical protein
VDVDVAPVIIVEGATSELPVDWEVETGGEQVAFVVLVETATVSTGCRFIASIYSVVTERTRRPWRTEEHNNGGNTKLETEFFFKNPINYRYSLNNVNSQVLGDRFCLEWKHDLISQAKAKPQVPQNSETHTENKTELTHTMKIGSRKKLSSSVAT